MNYHTAESLLAFENRIKDLFEQGELPFLLHLDGGNENELVDIFREIQEDDWIFSGHRAHYHALLAGIPPEKVEQLIRDGRSMFIFDKGRNFVTSSILGGTAGIAAGVALALKRSGSKPKVWCFLGDGAEDEGHVYEAIRFVVGHDLPCTFIIADNDRQVDTSHQERWGTCTRFNWASAMWMCGKENGGALSAEFNRRKVLRFRYTPTFPHAGRGPGPMIAFKPEVVARFAQS